MIYLLSPRRGGPFKQLQLISYQLNRLGYPAKHCFSAADWLRLHFNKRDKIVSVIPFALLTNPENLILNIRGHYLNEKRLGNPLSLLYDRNLRFAHNVVVPSHYLKKELKLSRASVIPTSTFINTSLPKYTSSSTNNVQLATITNFDFRPKAQGISKLINIVNQLVTSKKITINIYGGGRWLDHAKQQFNLHNYKKYPVVFHGYFKKATDVLPGNDIFIYWSTFDNMPNVLIEALACALPIVANRYAAYEEVLGSDNLLADSEDQFAKHLISLIENPSLRQSYSELNLKRARLFDIARNINKWLDVINQ